MRFLISYLPPESLVGGAMFGSSPLCQGGGWEGVSGWTGAQSWLSPARSYPTPTLP